MKEKERERGEGREKKSRGGGETGPDRLSWRG